jgi:hypothetical protein
MQDRSRKRGQGPPDPNKLAFDIVQMATGQAEKPEQPEKNQAAVTLGRLGGLRGGKARASILTAKERSDIARRAAKTRWTKETT